MERLRKLIRPAAALLVAVIAVTLAASCSGGPATFAPNELKAMLADALVATSGAAFFHHDMTLNMNGDTPGDAETPGNFQVNMTSQGVADVTADEMQTDLEISFGMKLGDQDLSMQDVAATIYQVDGYLYLKPDQENGTWRRTAVSPELTQAFGMNLVQGQFAMLASPVSIEYLRDEKVGGAACRVLSVIPDTGLLIQWLRAQGALPSEDIDWSKAEALAKLFQDVTVQVWVDKDAKFIRKMTAAITAVITPDMTSDPSSGQPNLSVDIALALTLSDYNKTVDITLPPDARNAPEVAPENFTFT
jgi:hypothetical protein